MEAGLLFYRAHRTAVCQEALERFAARYSFAVSGVDVCVHPEELNGAIARLLRGCSVLFLVSACPERQPECAPEIFQTLDVPLDDGGNPKGILTLAGKAASGFVIESADQAIVLLPDIPEEILQMLPGVSARLQKKFRLTPAAPLSGFSAENASH